MTFAFASAIITKHSANAYRGIAQLVEQRSPKPRAVSSKLTTPAINAQVLRSLCVLFCTPAAGPNHLEWPPHSLWPFSAEISFLCSCSGNDCGHFQNTFFTGRGRRENQHVFCNFLKFMLDKQTVFRYNRARSGGKHRAKLERSWPGSSVG